MIERTDSEFTTKQEREMARFEHGYETIAKEVAEITDPNDYPQWLVDAISNEVQERITKQDRGAGEDIAN